MEFRFSVGNTAYKLVGFMGDIGYCCGAGLIKNVSTRKVSSFSDQTVPNTSFSDACWSLFDACRRTRNLQHLVYVSHKAGENTDKDKKKPYYAHEVVSAMQDSSMHGESYSGMRGFVDWCKENYKCHESAPIFNQNSGNWLVSLTIDANSPIKKKKATKVKKS